MSLQSSLERAEPENSAGSANGSPPSTGESAGSRAPPLQPQRSSQASLADDRPNPLPSPASGFSRRTAQQRALSPSDGRGGSLSLIYDGKETLFYLTRSRPCGTSVIVMGILARSSHAPCATPKAMNSMLALLTYKVLDTGIVYETQDALWKWPVTEADSSTRSSP